MSRDEILVELEKMTDEERREIMEAAARLMRDKGKQSPTPYGALDDDKEWEECARIMQPEYAARGELTEFTALDAEDFHDA
jgi:hypothetical protein